MGYLAGFKLLTTIHRGKHCTIRCAIRESDQTPVIIKQLNNNTNTPEELNRFEHEEQLLRSLDIQGVVAPLSLTPSPSQAILVFPDLGGRSLRQVLQSDAFSWHQLLPIAIGISELLGRLHSERVIHKKLSPDNILWLAESNRVQLIDFSFATRLTREQASWNSQQLSIDDLRYIAPEQTGRINRHIDYRSDFYSLGVTLYEAFCGRPPFRSDERLKLIHSHIAKHPKAPHKVNPALPEMISRIIIKLMAKDAAERYQSSFALSQDLKKCLVFWQQQHSIPLFNLASQDISEHFSVPQRLYGRAATIQKLRNSFDRMIMRRQEVILITGYAGVGKSSLVHELRHYIYEQNGRFISGKFDQFRRNRPYSGILTALQALIRQLLTESEQEISHYRNAILTALGQHACALIRLLPELELVIGQQPNEGRASTLEELNRFSRLIKTLLQVFATEEQPLLLFLDDLHWGDLASLNLISSLCENGDIPNLLLVGSYRDQEVGPTHPLTLTIERIKTGSCNLSEILLEPLNKAQIVRLIADTLRTEPQRCTALAQLCLEKTQGNPFFLIQFLYSLHDEGLISFHENRWQWDEGKIQAREMSDNVIDLMVHKIQKLSKKSQTALQLAACIGNPFDLNTLSTVLEETIPKVTDDLVDAVQEGLLIPLNINYPSLSGQTFERHRYRFVHDRIQQAAYSLIPEALRQQLHLQIGRLLQQRFIGQSSAPLFEITNHLNSARSLIESSQELTELASLNCQSGLQALDSAAFDAAQEYFQIGIELLPDHSWKQHYDLTLTLYKSGAEAAYISSQFEQMNYLIDEVIVNCDHVLDRVKVYEIRIQSYIARNKFEQAMHEALHVLQMLGIVLPSNPSQIHIWKGILRTQWLLHRRTEEQLLNAPPMQDPHDLAALSILASMFGAVKFSSSALRPLIMAKEVELTLTRGITAHSPMAFAGYGGTLCGKYFAIEQGYKLGCIAMQLDHKKPDRLLHHRTTSLFDCYVRHWKEPLKNSADSLLEGHLQALNCGDVEWGSYSLAAWIQYAFTQTDNFADIQPIIENYTQTLQQHGQKPSIQYSLQALQTIDNFLGHNPRPNHFFGRFFTQEMLDENHREDHRTAIATFHYYAALYCYIVEDYPLALHHCQTGAPYQPHIVGTYTYACFDYMTALTLLAQIEQCSVMHQRHRLKQVKRLLQRAKRWAKHCPDNHQLYAALLQAELYRVNQQYSQAMDYYDSAINAAESNRFYLIAALAKEAAGRCYLQWHKDNIAKTYLNEAWDSYAHLQIKPKLQQLQQQYPGIFDDRKISNRADDKTVINVDDAAQLSNQHLDTISVIRSSQAISDEIELEKLLGRLMTLTLESAGAQRVTLILKKKEHLYIEAEAEADRAPHFFNDLALEDSNRLPISIIHYVARAQENIVLSNAHSHEMFMQDRYIRKHKPRSLLCMPILYHGELTAVLYLENNESRNVFDPSRLETLQILAAQAAISIENAKLYSSLKHSEQEYRSLFENTVEAIFRASPQGHFISANPALAELLGYASPAEFLDAITDIASQCFANSYDLHSFLKQLAQNNRVTDFETAWLRRDGSSVNLSISARRELDHQGNALYYEGSLTNITERKAKEQAQLNLQRSEAASQAKSEFLATISHEIRTPMNGILGMAQLLETQPLQAEQRKQVQAIYQSGQTLLSILNDVLDFTKVEAGQTELEQAPFSIRQVLEELELILRPMAHNKQLQLQLNIIDSLPTTVIGDRRSLSQVLMNLCANAIKFTQQGFVTITARCQSNDDSIRLHVSIKDSGIGIPKESHPRIFQHFSQADSSITRRYGGTGLGLAISKKIIELQQGEIGFDSEAGKGSHFWFSLPYQRAAKTVENSAQPAQRFEGHPLSILLVEDTEINQQVAKGLLESDGHHVDIAVNGYQALQQHDQHDYDLVLMDIHLPDMDGMETTRRLRQHANHDKANIRVIALTASITEAEINNYYSAGIDAVIGKPIQFTELQHLIGQQQALTDDAPTMNSTDITDPAHHHLNQSLIQQHANMLGVEKFTRLIDQLETQCEQLLSQLEQAQQQNNPTEPRAILHQLSGAAANFGLLTLAADCKALEEDSDKVTAMTHDELHHLLQISLAELRAFNQRHRQSS
ncbi:AAA family ATPase [Amphritea sp. 1_MG-2023]|uniref:AAA family ATPase n=1 Tax=Amphritea sp. 1_MG-2023 TaxID=3062670 RepID=UPI0026E2CDA2|nr:AAA family ATPase [Amphritea sp. 1_MG-2023]MDO6561869.1 AAA family ATPase [Amphritea sp. 1_MG-2023]